MLQSILTKVLTKAAIEHGAKKDQKFIENYNLEQPTENVVFKGYENQYLENLAAASRMMGWSKMNSSVYNRVVESYTLYYDDFIYLNNYKKNGIRITYQQLAEIKISGKMKYNAGRGFITLKLNNEKYLMYVCGADKDRAKEQEITYRIAMFLQEKCGVKIIDSI